MPPTIAAATTTAIAARASGLVVESIVMRFGIPVGAGV